MADEELKTLKRYTWEEVKEHRSSDSLWIVVNGKVYDVTPFLDEHPGGEEVLMEHAGGDATEAFEDVGHSPDAKDIQKTYLIGEISGDQDNKKARTHSWATGDSKNKPAGSSSWSSTGLIVLFLVLLAAYVYRNYAHLFTSDQKGQ